MTKFEHMMALGALLVAGTPALAQGADNLPDRPIARAEISAVVKQQFAAMDSNHDGIISPAEFEAYRVKQAAGQLGDQPAIVRTFGHVGSHWYEHADVKGDGRVTLEEAQARPLQMFDTADMNHDGVVDLQERKLATMMMGLKGR